MKVILILSFLMLLPSTSLACVAPPTSLVTPHAELVARTGTIVLAQAVGRSKKSGLQFGKSKPLVKFKVAEVLKGNIAPAFMLPNGFFSSESDEIPEDFNGHNNAAYWDQKLTRQWNWPDCNIYPEFKTNRTYLLFLGRPHWRAYEEIRSPNDLWLNAVRHLVRNPENNSGISMLIRQWMLLYNGIFVGRLISCGGPTYSVDKVLHGKFEKDWRPIKNSYARYPSDGKCGIGNKFLVMTFDLTQNPDRNSNVGSYILPVRGGTVNLTWVISRSEINVLGNPVVNIDNLKVLPLRNTAD